MGVGRIQMNFIHLLSTEAVQHVTVHCLNAPVWAAEPGRLPTSRAVSFRAWTGEKIQAGDLLEPLVARDDCWVGTAASLREAEVLFETLCRRPRSEDNNVETFICLTAYFKGCDKYFVVFVKR